MGCLVADHDIEPVIPGPVAVDAVFRPPGLGRNGHHGGEDWCVGFRRPSPKIEVRSCHPRASFPLEFVIWLAEHSVDSYVVSSLMKNVGALVRDLLHTSVDGVHDRNLASQDTRSIFGTRGKFPGLGTWGGLRNLLRTYIRR